jgi:hypothetical protein
VAGSELLRFAGVINLNELKEMERAIEEGCEQVYPNDCVDF